ncbi:tyrosine-protein phosphatase [Limnochorda pilosa]|uniref:protein-tyrosine-phosphatase n=1 Tax=Limnochorda pilosa TaxID=1555112 RepID=A0A0K2SMM0_LIMPI|nr:CpsB/CapC family capsule biosynthesis tyrosine phosphatase [Limnochorda pilosa]BAS28247.1 tyrosine protein phosphatase [Limnochorda pilosa]
MIDLHAHLLPGVDDGPATLDDAVRMAETAAASGTRVVVTTPHMQPGGYPYRPSVEQLTDRLNELRVALDERRIPLQVLLGSEVLFSVDVPERLRRREALPLADGPYVLVELAGDEIPYGFEERLFELQLEGYHPILAHPERHPAFQRNPSLVHPLLDRGVLLQITGGSLLGQFGRASLMTAETFVLRGLAHLMASDGHSPERRPPVMKAARARVVELAGPEAALWMTEEAPARIVAGEPLPTTVPVGPARPRRRGLGRTLRRWGHAVRHRMLW